ncbi:MAG: hypothetical protein EOP09_14220 [Proteobacteria bacterium]|nr:MAG: hypothetical protein EOP09_14220 [Pseudomonadota bacterium]
MWADAHLRMSLKVFNGSSAREYHDIEQLKGIICPVLLLTADPEKGAIVTSSDAGALQALIPQLEVRHIAGAGHSIRREQFQPFLQEVKAFLKRIG